MFAEKRFGLPVPGKQEAGHIGGQLMIDFLTLHAFHHRLSVSDDIDGALGILPFIRGRRHHDPGRVVENCDSRIRIRPPVHRRGAKPRNQSQHSRFGMFHPETVGAFRVAHPGSAGHEEILMSGTGDPLNQKCHLLIQLIKPSALAVIESGEADSACVDGAHRRLKCLQFLFRASFI